jgi:hypothetical protein
MTLTLSPADVDWVEVQRKNRMLSLEGRSYTSLLNRFRVEIWKNIKDFFEDKKFHAGGNIPLSMLVTEKNFANVVSTPFGEGIDMAYEIFARSNISPPVGFDHESIDWDVYYILCLLEEMKKHQIRQEFQAGMLLLYFKICKGQKLPEIPLDITHLIR